MDEDESKVRRNLVWLSSLIVGWWFVGLDLSEVAKKLVGTDKIDHPARVWIVIAVMLYYVLARFWNSSQATSARIELLAFRKGEFGSRVNNILTKDLEDLKNTGQAIFLDLKWVAPKGLTEMLRAKTVNKGIQIDLATIQLNSPFGRKGSVRLTATDQPFDDIAFVLPLWPHIRFAFKTWFKMLAWDNETTYFMFPLILWLGAVAITICNLWEPARVWLGV